MRGVSLIALVITIVVIIILAAIVIGGIANSGGDESDRCMIGYYEHKYIQISKYDSVNHQYYMTAVCERCGKELKAQKDY